MAFRLVKKSVTLNDLERRMTADARNLCHSAVAEFPDNIIL